MLISLTHFGAMQVWTVNYTQNFSAFAPSFQEIDENVAYVEKEDEFDLDRQQALIKAISAVPDENEKVDIFSQDILDNVISETDSDSGEGPFFIPVVL
jgi:COMPASS component SWD1